MLAPPKRPTLRKVPVAALLPFLIPALLGAQDPAASQPAAPKIPEDKEVVTTASGLKYSVLNPGDPKGIHPKIGDKVKVHYTGWLTDGKVFDSSVQRGQPAEFVLGRVIEGWNEVVALMTKGERVKVTIPPELGYGERGAGNDIPPNATLIFEVELLDLKVGPALPVWRDGDPKKQNKSDNGLVVETVKEGAGESVGAEAPLEIRFAFWNPGKQLLDCAELGTPLYGPPKNFRLELFKQLLPTLKPGQRVRCEVPPELAFGDRGMGPKLPGKTTSIWELEVVRKIEVPAFAMSDEKKLVTTKSGLKYEVLKEGTGKTPTVSDQVLAFYTGWLTNGKEFDSAHRRGQPTPFGVSGVIKGWTEGLQLMKEGAIYKFTIPPDLAYGAEGAGADIPANATLVFVIELLKAGS